MIRYIQRGFRCNPRKFSSDHPCNIVLTCVQLSPDFFQRLLHVSSLQFYPAHSIAQLQSTKTKACNTFSKILGTVMRLETNYLSIYWYGFEPLSHKSVYMATKCLKKEFSSISEPMATDNNCKF